MIDPIRPDLILSEERGNICQDLFVCFILHCWMEIELWRHETISYRQIGELLSLSSTNIFNSRKRQIPELVFCFGIDLQFSSPSPSHPSVLLSEYNLYKLSNSWYRGVHFRDSLPWRGGRVEVFFLLMIFKTFVWFIIKVLLLLSPPLTCGDHFYSTQYSSVNFYLAYSNSRTDLGLPGCHKY